MSEVECTTREERWRDIPGFVGYQVSDLGQVRSRWRFGAAKSFASDWHLLRQKTLYNGKRYLLLSREKKKITCYVHRLVLEAFVGPCPEGMECCHENDIGHDNRLENLRWATRLENMADRERNGRTLRGEGHGSSLVTDAQAMEIRRRGIAGEAYRRIGPDYGVSASAAAAIAKGRSFGHLPGPVAKPRWAGRALSAPTKELSA